MAAPRYGQKKDANQGGIVEGLVAIGCTVEILHTPCDLLVGYRGKNFLMEIKNRETRARRKTGGRTKLQVAFADTWRGQLAKVETLDEAMRVVGAVQ